MYTLLDTPGLNIHSMITRHQIIRLQEIIIELQHRLMNREAIECATLIRQSVYSFGAVTFEWIAATLGCGARGLFGFETGELCERVGDLGRGVDRG